MAWRYTINHWQTEKQLVPVLERMTARASDPDLQMTLEAPG
jgi:hypothetical protein